MPDTRNRRAGRGGEGLHVRVTWNDGMRLRALATAHDQTLSERLRELLNLGLHLEGKPTLEKMLPIGRPRNP